VSYSIRLNLSANDASPARRIEADAAMHCQLRRKGMTRRE
jgi:hypothetical protein